jgi:hypothetical protein
MLKNYSFNQLSFVLLLVYDFETFLATFLVLLLKTFKILIILLDKIQGIYFSSSYKISSLNPAFFNVSRNFFSAAFLALS